MFSIVFYFFFYFRSDSVFVGWDWEQIQTIAIKIWFSSTRLDQSNWMASWSWKHLAHFLCLSLFISKSINFDHENDWFPVRVNTKILPFFLNTLWIIIIEAKNKRKTATVKREKKNQYVYMILDEIVSSF